MIDGDVVVRRLEASEISEEEEGRISTDTEDAGSHNAEGHEIYVGMSLKRL